MKNYYLINRKIWMVIIAIIITSASGLFAQETLDVLPSEGRTGLFHNYLLEELDALVDQRKLAVEDALTTVEKLQLRQKKLREDYINLIGNLPDKTPLNAEITGTIEMTGYSIDKVHYQSRPNHHVTGNLYYPTTGTGPYPGILVTVGHYPNAKTEPLLQNLCILMATNGFVVFIVDPICQGERAQVKDPETGALLYNGQSGTSAHSILDVGATMVGSSVMAYELWDNHRGIDYLISRSEVDTAKIGLTGSSGGGAQATYLAAFDQRIKVAAVNSFIMNEPTLFKTIGPQTGSQNLSYEGYYEIDHPEYITMFAPKPYMVLAGVQDFFDVKGTRETMIEVKKIYDKFGVVEKVDSFIYSDGHGYSLPKREAATQWFRRWFYDDNSTITEPTFTTNSDATLLVTTTGEVTTSFDSEVTVSDINYDIAISNKTGRESFWNNNSHDSCINMVKSLIRLDEDYATPTVEVVETIDRDTYTVEKIKITDGNLVPVTGLLFEPKGNTEKLSAMLYVDGRGKKVDAEAGGILEKICLDSNKIIFAIDVRGFGETIDAPGQNESKHENKEHRNAVITLYTGKTLIGQRVEDIKKATDYLAGRDDVNDAKVSIYGIDRAGTAVLHAAAIYSNYTSVIVQKTDSNWLSVVKNPLINDMMTHVVPSSLLYYDLPDLVNAIPVPVKYSLAIDSRLSRIALRGADIIPDFSPGILTYDVVPSKAEVKLIGYAADANASLSGGGTYDLSTESKVVEIVVTAEDGETKSTYTFNIDKLTSVEGLKSNLETKVYQNYPNPFSGNTTITYHLGKSDNVSLKIFDTSGKEVETLVNETKTPGTYNIDYNTNKLAPGVYIYQLKTDKLVINKKMIKEVK